MGQAGPVITTHSGALAAVFGRSPVTFSHDLPTAGMFSLDVLGDLSLRMELPAIEIEVPASPTDGTMVSRVPDVPVRDMIMSIPVGNSWVVLKDVQADEHYEAPVGALLREPEDLVTPVAQGFAARRGHVFIASEGAVTPTHADDDEGLLLQIHGRKEVTLYDMGRSYFSPRLARKREGSARVFAAPQKVAEEVGHRRAGARRRPLHPVALASLRQGPLPRFLRVAHRQRRDERHKVTLVRGPYQRCSHPLGPTTPSAGPAPSHRSGEDEGWHGPCAHDTPPTPEAYDHPDRTSDNVSRGRGGSWGM